MRRAFAAHACESAALHMPSPLVAEMRASIEELEKERIHCIDDAERAVLLRQIADLQRRLVCFVHDDQAPGAQRAQQRRGLPDDAAVADAWDRGQGPHRRVAVQLHLRTRGTMVSIHAMGKLAR